MDDAFSRCHPLVCALYVALVLAGTVCLTHPALLAVSVLSGALYARRLARLGTGRLPAGAIGAVMVLTALANPAFTHAGVTILTYLPSGNPLTLESVDYGLAAAAMLGGALLWGICWSAVMTADKLTELLGRAAPALSLMVTMTLRLVPRLGRRLRAIREAQRCIRREEDRRGAAPLRQAVAALSILLTWSLESAAVTADSMKSRGYGLPGRTSFALHRLEGRDRALLAFLGLCGGYVLAGALAGGLAWRYYPSLRGGAAGPFPVSFFLAYLALALTPVWLDVWERQALRRRKRAA